jgi:hypothetical protein
MRKGEEVVAHLLELAYNSLDELRWSAVHSHDRHLLAGVYDLEAVPEAFP